MKNKLFNLTVMLFGVGLVVLAPASNAFSSQLIKRDAAINKIYPNATDIQRKQFSLSSEQLQDIESKTNIDFEKSHLSEIIRFDVFEDKKFVGYAFEDTVKGKWGPIHYLFGVDIKGNILEVIVLDYLEIRGKPVAKKRFLNQYKNKNVKSPLMLGKDIDGITGATISSRSLTDGIRKVLQAHSVLQAAQ